MKKLFLLKSLLLLCALVAGSSSVWAGSETFIFNTEAGLQELGISKPDPNSGTALSTDAYTLGVVSLSATTAAGKTDTRVWNSNGTLDLRIYSGGTLTFTASSNNIKSIVITGSAVSGFSASVGTFSAGTWTGEATSVTLTATGTDKINTITVTYEAADSRTAVSINSLIFNPTSLVVGEGNAQATAGHDTPACETATFTYESLNTDIATCTSAGVITPVAKGTATIKATMSIPNDDPDYKAATTTFTADITVNNPSHKATFYVNGAKLSEVDVEEGETITFPANPASISDLDFVGWSATALSGTQPTAPTFVNTATETMGDADVTYYAVFAKVTGNEPAGWIETALADITTSDVFVFSNGTKAMNNDGGTSSAPSQNSITVSEGKITSEVADELKWNVSGNATDGYTFYPNGSKTTWLYCNTTASSSSNDNIRVGTGNRKVWVFTQSGYLQTNDTYTDRYLSIYSTQDFRGYINTNNAFVPKFYKYTEGSIIATDYCTTIVLGFETIATGSGKTWGTYVTTNALDLSTVSDQITAYIIPGLNAGGTAVETVEVTQIPAGSPILFQTATAGSSVNVPVATSTPAALGTNCLKAGTGGEIAAGTGTVSRYVLSSGVFKLIDDVLPTVPKNKAYLEIDTGSGAPELSIGYSETTGIDAVTKSQLTETVVYNLNGQRVAQPTKGLYIVNGKKVIMK